GSVLFSKFSPAANATSTTATRPCVGGAGRFPGCSTNITSTQLYLTPVARRRPPNRSFAPPCRKLSCGAHAEPPRQAAEGRVGDREAGASTSRGRRRRTWSRVRPPSWRIRDRRTARWFRVRRRSGSTRWIRRRSGSGTVRKSPSDFLMPANESLAATVADDGEREGDDGQGDGDAVADARRQRPRLSQSGKEQHHQDEEVDQRAHQA